jgi:hypothetical protein
MAHIYKIRETSPEPSQSKTYDWAEVSYKRNMAIARRHAPLLVTWLLCALGLSVMCNALLFWVHL